ncbi:MAG: MraY family glycosyltransferase [Candidatus Nanopelagicales bacterium]
MREYGLSLLVAAAMTYIVMPAVRMLALRSGAVAGVRDRDVHDQAIPRWGGLGMFFGLLAGMVMASKLPMMRSVFEGVSQEGAALLAGAVIIVVLGLADDRWELDAPTKMAGQILAAGVMSLQGISLLWLPIGGVLVLDPTTSVLLTVLIVLISVNAINFVDGLDGLAAGITGVSALAFFVYAYLLSVQYGVERATLSALVSALLVGMCLGFLPHNAFPARLFMGDTGSMLIGYLMAASVITLTGKVDPNALEGTTLLPALLPILVPLCVLAVPLIDLALAVIRRTRAGRSPFAPDKQHLHHRLLEMGHSQRRAVLLLTGWAALISFTAVLMAFVPMRVALPAGILGAGLLAAAVVLPGRSKRRAARAEQSADAARSDVATSSDASSGSVSAPGGDPR